MRQAPTQGTGIQLLNYERPHRLVVRNTELLAVRHLLRRILPNYLYTSPALNHQGHPSQHKSASETNADAMQHARQVLLPDLCPRHVPD